MFITRDPIRFLLRVCVGASLLVRKASYYRVNKLSFTRCVVEIDEILFLRVDTIVQAINSVSEVTSLGGAG